MTTPWQVKVAAARMVQRAYRSIAGVVRFYPSHAMIGMEGVWGDTFALEVYCQRGSDTRLPDAEARALWAKRPKGMK